MAAVSGARPRELLGELDDEESVLPLAIHREAFTGLFADHVEEIGVPAASGQVVLRATDVIGSMQTACRIPLPEEIRSTARYVLSGLSYLQRGSIYHVGSWLASSRLAHRLRRRAQLDRIRGLQPRA